MGVTHTIPAFDGYYWLKNDGVGGALWRIVLVYDSPTKQGRAVSSDGLILTRKKLIRWKGVEFHGPLQAPMKSVNKAIK